MIATKTLKSILLIIFYTAGVISFSQNENSTYLMYEKSMVITNIEEKVKLKFGIQANDNEPCIYNFNINNAPKVGGSFEYLKFNDIKNLSSEEELKKGEVLTIEELLKYNFCDLQYLFADTENLYLIKKVDGVIYKYKLSFWSSQRGWSTIKQ